MPGRSSGQDKEAVVQGPERRTLGGASLRILPALGAFIACALGPCSMDGWLYPTYPPLTKGRKQTPLLSGCSLLLAVLSFVNELLNLYNSRRVSPT